jgi:hypothetical protein
VGWEGNDALQRHLAHPLPAHLHPSMCGVPAQAPQVWGSRYCRTELFVGAFAGLGQDTGITKVRNDGIEEWAVRRVQTAQSMGMDILKTEEM